jgi:hypothetical protein
MHAPLYERPLPSGAEYQGYRIEGFPGRMSKRGDGRLYSSKTHHTAAINRSASASLSAVTRISADAKFDMDFPPSDTKRSKK